MNESVDKYYLFFIYLNIYYYILLLNMRMKNNKFKVI